MSPSLLRCALIIAAVKIRLRLRGVQGTLCWMRAGSGRAGLAPDDIRATIARTRDAVQSAAALYPGRALCLEQSIALSYLLRRAGVAVELRFGVKPNPFEAHAWVEYAREPINDFPEHVKYFAPMPETSS